MKLASYAVEGRPTWGAVIGDGLVDLGPKHGATLRAAIAANALPAIAKEIAGARASRPVSSVTFLPAVAVERGLAAQLGLERTILAARGIRAVNKSRMVHNAATPHIEVNPETYEVRADGVHLTCEPATVLPLAQRYFLY